MPEQYTEQGVGILCQVGSPASLNSHADRSMHHVTAICIQQGKRPASIAPVSSKSDVCQLAYRILSNADAITAQYFCRHAMQLQAL